MNGLAFNVTRDKPKGWLIYGIKAFMMDTKNRNYHHKLCGRCRCVRISMFKVSIQQS